MCVLGTDYRQILRGKAGRGEREVFKLGIFVGGRVMFKNWVTKFLKGGG